LPAAADDEPRADHLENHARVRRSMLNATPAARLKDRDKKRGPLLLASDSRPHGTRARCCSTIPRSDE
jgi:hypothetical protein